MQHTVPCMCRAHPSPRDKRVGILRLDALTRRCQYWSLFLLSLPNRALVVPTSVRASARPSILSVVFLFPSGFVCVCFFVCSVCRGRWR